VPSLEIATQNWLHLGELRQLTIHPESLIMVGLAIQSQHLLSNLFTFLGLDKNIRILSAILFKLPIDHRFKEISVELLFMIRIVFLFIRQFLLRWIIFQSSEAGLPAEQRSGFCLVELVQELSVFAEFVLAWWSFISIASFGATLHEIVIQRQLQKWPKNLLFLPHKFWIPNLEIPKVFHS